MKKLLTAFFAATIAQAPTAPALAQSDPFGELAKMEDAQLIEEIWRSAGDMPQVFAPSFLAQVPAAQIVTLLAPLQADLGTAETVRKTGEGEYELLTATHRVPVFINRDSDGLITGLLLKPAVSRVVDKAATLQTFIDMAPQVSVLATTDGETVAEVNPDLRLAVGSAFKLHVLAELQSRIEAGDMAWADVVELQARHISLPSGMMQDLPLGTPITLQIVAQVMISISDNTATDLLIDVLGREALERRSGNVPFITTRELFHMRTDRDLANRYVQADDVQMRRGLLDGLTERPLPSTSGIRPFTLEHPAEWYMSGTELCSVMKQVADLPLMAVEPGPLPKKDWERIAYKGGSEGGVLNMTAQFEGADGRSHCLAVTLNSDRPIDATKFTSAFVDLATSLGAD
ncbi:MAG: serine hydrolase [Pseudomonadota bacterium]